MMSFLNKFSKLELEIRSRNSILVFSSSSVFAQLLTMVYMLMLARYLGPIRYGIFITPFTIANLTSIIFSLGLDTWLLQSNSTSKPILNTTGKVFKLKLITGSVWALMLITLAPNIRPDLYPSLLLSLIVLDVWSDSLLHTILASLNVARKIKQYSFMILFARGIRIIFLLILILLNVKSIVLIAGIRACLSILSMLIAVILVKPAKKGLSNREGLEILKSAQPFAFSELLSLIYTQADVTLISLIKNQTSTGIYAPVSNMINALFIIPSSIHLYVIPVLSRDFISNKKNYTKNVSRLLSMFLLLGSLMTVILGLSGKRLVTLLLGEAYEQTGRLIVFLSPLLFLKSMEFGFVSNIIAMNKQKYRLIPQIVAASVNILINLWAITRYGEFGAALAYITSEVVLFVGYGIVFFYWFKEMKSETK